MAKLARDTIPFAQEQVIRTFLADAEATLFVIPPKLRGTLIGLLGYKTAPNGVLVWKSIECKWQLGENYSTNWIDTFESDWETLCEARNTTDPDRAPDTRASEPAEGN